MRQFLILFLAIMLSCAAASAQTRKIAHLSHAGKPSTFAAYWAGDNFGNIRPNPEYEMPGRLTVPSKGQNPTQVTPDSVPETPDQAAPESSVDQPSGKIDKVNETPRGRNGKKPKKPRRKDSIGPSGSTFFEQSGSFPQDVVANSATKNEASAPKPKGNGWILLMGLLLFPVAPGVFLVYAVVSSHGKDSKQG